MTVAWIGNRSALVQHAVEHAAELLAASRCPVISIDADIHGTRAAVALAGQVGAAYDHLDGGGLARETALFSDRGGMFVTAGEVRRRADLVVIVGDLPPASHDFVSELAETAPDLAGRNARDVFLVSSRPRQAMPLGDKVPVTRLACGSAGLPATLAAMRAQYAGRHVTRPVSNFSRFSDALGKSRFTAFLCSGYAVHQLVLDMLQGLVADLNKKARASLLFLPTSEAGWGSTLVSTWTTGFPMRTSFSRGFAEFDPWRWNVERMIADGEADLHLWIAAKPNGRPSGRKETRLIALTKTGQPVSSAAVTIPIGEPGEDHDAVFFSNRTGTLAGRSAQAPSQLPSAAAIIRSIAQSLPEKMDRQC